MGSNPELLTSPIECGFVHWRLEIFFLTPIAAEVFFLSIENGTVRNVSVPIFSVSIGSGVSDS